MIFIENHDVKEKDFVTLLANARVLILRLLCEHKENITSGSDFELLVFDKMCKAAEETYFDNTVRQTGAHAFPDIIANRYFGVEVKMTIKDQWVSTGNSVLESTRMEDVEKIYMFFGKLGGKKDISFKPYHECLYEVSVTHSPRYKIDMNLEKGQTIFAKIGIDYDEFRKEPNPIKKIKEYYRGLLKSGEDLWWIDQEVEDKSVSLIMKPFRYLNPAEQENFRMEAMILFPEIFSKRQSKYERAAAYLISRYNAFSAHVRDEFTSKGQETVKIKGVNVTIPRIYYNLFIRAKDIKKKIEKFDAETLNYYWNVKIKKDRLAQWKNILIEKSNFEHHGLTAVDIFEEGLF